MMQSYIQMIEEIIQEMKTELSRGGTDITGLDYMEWMDFLKRINPRSELLKEETEAVMGPEPNDKESSGMRHFSNIRELMVLAEVKQYPAWFIQPKFKEVAMLEYEKGLLKDGSIDGVPRMIGDFTGVVSGAWVNTQFIAYDVDISGDFLEKMAWLESAGFEAVGFASFPTEKIPTISSSKLEAFFRNYLASAQEQGLDVDGIVIISNTALYATDNHMSNRIAFTPI